MSLLVDYNYIPNDIDTEMMLTEVPIDILEENILEQFQNPLENHQMDYVSNFIIKYRYSKAVVESTESEDDDLELQRIRTDFLDFIEKTFQEKLDIEFPDLEGMIEEDQDDCIHFTYRFFITNFKQNFVNLVLNYIEKHKKEICDFLPKKKDVSTLTFRKDIEDPDDILILTNLDEIIDYVLSRGFTVEEFLDLIDRDEPSLERYLLEQYYDEAKIVGNFLDKYFRMVTRNFKIEIECAVRNDILKKYLKFL